MVKVSPELINCLKWTEFYSRLLLTGGKPTVLGVEKVQCTQEGPAAP